MNKGMVKCGKGPRSENAEDGPYIDFIYSASALIQDVLHYFIRGRLLTIKSPPLASPVKDVTPSPQLLGNNDTEISYKKAVRQGAITPFLTGPLLAPTTPRLSSGVQRQQNQTYHFGLRFKDTSFVSIPADSLHNDHSNPYVPSEGDIESDDSEWAGEIPNSELTNNLPHVTTKKKECRAVAQAKQVVGMGKCKRSSNKSRPAPAKQHRAVPSPDVAPTISSVDRRQADVIFASSRQKAMKLHSSIYHFFTEIHENQQQHC
ncbi:hypothetical protein EDB85DRAFT_2273057 [Lactarius pseudohatsudake]|nr:hypothetical protein EDB85DRAFT_2273057 [Lactarius pseudohatsudake]